MQIFHYCVGVDISKEKFDCVLSQLNFSRTISVISHSKFSNNSKGFKEFLEWIASLKKIGIKLIIVMEATGVYYENLAYYLDSNSNYQISVILPAKAKYYFKSLGIKTKTDKIDAKMLCQFGLERKLDSWQSISKNMRNIKQLSRDYRNLKIELNRLKNKLHAKKHSFEPHVFSIELIKQHIELIENQCSQIEVELEKLVSEDTFLSDKIEKVCTIPGVRFMTVVTVVSETDGFNLIKNGKQLCSYSGLDVKHNNSGNKEGRSKISKQGNRYIRQALYMPALSASRYIKPLNDFYNRINDKNTCKKIGLIGVSRKLLILIYTLWRKDEEFDATYKVVRA